MPPAPERSETPRVRVLVRQVRASASFRRARPPRIWTIPRPIAIALTPKARTEVKSVGLAAGGLKGVLLDDLGLAVGRERAVDDLAGVCRGVLGDGDLLGGELGLDHRPGADSADEHERTDDRDDQAGELDEP